ncbi:glyoxylate/hydroxypyruvate reductase B-like [Dromiciops gliroides]|uniref:glyoxylate/hydroxypyruvate reductase B-like n=1 Tax=Dromiciops gliroides TaxID=33562 RepID=UPI001CC4C21A|nr:glyoxylate/hydroxypyruvate reductase B-like [Dromiciops gliroides]
MKDPKLPCVLISGYEDLYSVNKDHVGDLKKHFNLITMQEFLENKPNFSQKIKAIYVWGGKPWIDQELLQSLPTLKIIANLGAGLDHLDLNMIASFGVKLANTKHAVTNSTADMGMALLLASARRLLEGYEVATSPDTKSFSINWMGQEVTGSTLGIIGMGKISIKVAQRAKGFEMKILYHNRNRSLPGYKASSLSPTSCVRARELEKEKTSFHLGQEGQLSDTAAVSNQWAGYPPRFWEAPIMSLPLFLPLPPFHIPWKDWSESACLTEGEVGAGDEKIDEL